MSETIDSMFESIISINSYHFVKFSTRISCNLYAHEFMKIVPFLKTIIYLVFPASCRRITLLGGKEKLNYSVMNDMRNLLNQINFFYDNPNE